MLISLNEIKKLVKIPSTISTSELIRLIDSRLVEIEGSVNWGERYDHIYIAKVISCEDIPGTHLHLCKIDAGPAGAEFAADYAKKHPDEAKTSDESLVQVVCGAPNVHAGMFAVWIAPGAIVPCTWEDEKFRLSVRPLRGYDSYGMLAGADELGFDTEHKAIAEISPKQLVPDGAGTAGAGSFRQVKPGDALKDVFDLDDVILDIENKSLTHRPDTFGLIGFAREVAGILGEKFEEPDLYKPLLASSASGSPAGSSSKTSTTNPALTIEITDPEACPRYTAAVFSVKNATESAKYLTDDAIFLAKAGMRSISKIVDATNIAMLMTGQPLHAFDYDKFVAVGQAASPKTSEPVNTSASPKILVRLATPGEKLKLLDGKTIDLNENDIIITSNNIPVALAGAMGGESTEIDASTERVILESATFSLFHLRKTQMSHGIFSEAITRFTKGQPAAGTLPSAEYCLRLLDIKDAAFVDRYPAPATAQPIKVTRSDINSLLGTDYSVSQIQDTLTNVSFGVVVKAEVFTVTPPAWRTDIHIKEDIIEEVGRLNGYDNILPTLPLRPFISAERNPLFDLKRELRATLSDRLHAHELLTYSFVSEALQQKCLEDPADSYKIVNSISPELQCFRQSIIPSLLEKVQLNQKSGYQDFALYEFNQISRASLGLTSENVPELENHLALVATGDYYTAKSTLETLARLIKLPLKLDTYLDSPATTSKKPATATKTPAAQATTTTPKAPAYFEPTRVVAVFSGSTLLGFLGEIRRSVLSKLKIEGTVSAFELNLDTLVQIDRHHKIDLHLSRFPFVMRDLTLQVPASITFEEVQTIIDATLSHIPDLIFKVKPISIYAKSDTERNLSFRLHFASTQKTLTSSEISAIMETVVGKTAQLGAKEA